MTIDDELLEVFRGEVEEQLDTLWNRLDGDFAAWDLVEICRLAHNIKGAARMVGIGSVRDAAHALEDLLTAWRDGALSGEAALAVEVQDGVRLLERCFTEPAADLGADLAAYRARVDGRLAGNGLVPAAAPDDPTDVPEQAMILPAEEDLAATAAETGLPEGADLATGAAGPGGTLRVHTQRIERLMELAGEFVGTVYRAQEQQQLAERVLEHLQELGHQHPDLARGANFRVFAREAAELRRRVEQDRLYQTQLSERLQDTIRMLRMVQMDTLGPALRRVIREASQVFDRPAELRIRGGQTEIDRGVLDQLRDPLVHLLRNAVAHGLEGPAERRRQGKPETGRIEFSARSWGSWVELMVADDGTGLDLDRLRTRAVERGLVSAAAAAELSDEEACELAFLGGLSTLDQANEIAGRGIGLDVVRRNVMSLGGSVSLETHPGRGSRFLLRVPLTRLTTAGVVFRLAEQWLAVPTLAVERTVLVEPDDVHRAEGQDVIYVDGDPVTVQALEQLLGLPAESPEIRSAVVLADGGRRRALIVDEVLGDREFIIQGLSWNLDGLSLIAGTAVMEEGRIVYVLNAPALLAGTRAVVSGSVVADAAGNRQERRRILVVDDSVTSRTLEKNILTAAGYDVRTAVDGEAGWQLLQADPGGVDLVVTDVEMPRLDGLGLTRRIRSHDALAALPVILVTSLGNEEHKRAGAEAGADAYVVKGEFDQDELLRSVRRLL